MHTCSSTHTRSNQRGQRTTTGISTQAQETVHHEGQCFFFLTEHSLRFLSSALFLKCLWSRFFYGKRQGLGVMQYADGSVYTGWWACSFYPWHETCFSLFFSSVFFASSWKTPSFPLFVFPATISICCLPLKINFLVFIGTKTTLGPGMGSYRAQTALP